LRLKPKLTLNLIVHSTAPPEVERGISTLQSEAQESHVAFNVLKTKNRPGDFVRDAAVMQGESVALMPDVMGGVGAMREAILQCEDLTVQEASSSKLLSAWPRAKYGIYDSRPETKSAGPLHYYAEGGNALPMPDGSVLMGIKKSRPIPGDVLRFFAPKKIVLVDLPEELPVGHVDELFQFIETKNCGFKILAASPVRLKAWAAKNPNIAQKFISPEYFPAEEFQGIIDTAKAKIWAQLKSSTKCGVAETFIDLPMGWNSLSRPYLSNPVNGLWVESNYLMPMLHAIDLRPGHNEILRLSELELEIKNILRTEANAREIEMVNTDFNDGLYFGTGGQVHCLTNHVSCDK